MVFDKRKISLSYNSLLRSFSAVNPEEPIEIAYVPSHLYHVMFELFKVSNDQSLRQ